MDHYAKGCQMSSFTVEPSNHYENTVYIRSNSAIGGWHIMHVEAFIAEIRRCQALSRDTQEADS